MIKYHKSSVARRLTFTTEKYGNLLSDTFQGEVYQNDDNTWSGWLINWSRKGNSQYKFDLISKRAAARWVNKRLREKGVTK